MKLERGEALLARPWTGRSSYQPAPKASGAPYAPYEMLVDWDENGRPDCFFTLGKPEPVIALVVGDDGVESVGGQFGANRQCAWIRI